MNDSMHRFGLKAKETYSFLATLVLYSTENTHIP